MQGLIEDGSSRVDDGEGWREINAITHQRMLLNDGDQIKELCSSGL